jgi:hypothetical protein
MTATAVRRPSLAREWASVRRRSNSHAQRAPSLLSALADPQTSTGLWIASRPAKAADRGAGEGEEHGAWSGNIHIRG